MTDTIEHATDHYTRMLAEAQGATAPVLVPLDVHDVDGLEVCNTEVGDRYESFELGPYAGNRYLRIRSRDNVVLAAVFRRLADDLEQQTFDERDRVAKRCICGARIDADEDTCGAARCEYQVGGF